MNLLTTLLFPLLLLFTITTAHTQPNYKNPPNGNPITTPTFNAQIAVNKPYTITWVPTTLNKVSIILLRGPSFYAVPIATLAEGIDNMGMFVWTPNEVLVPDTSRYELMLVVEGSGEYQFSAQFGISNDAYPFGNGGGSSVSASASASVSSSSSSSSPVGGCCGTSVTSTVGTTTFTTGIGGSIGVSPTEVSTATPTSADASPSDSSVVATASSSNASATFNTGDAGVSATSTPAQTPASLASAAGQNVVSLGGIVAVAVAIAAAVAIH